MGARMSDVKIDYLGKSYVDWRTLPYEVTYIPPTTSTQAVDNWLNVYVGTRTVDWDRAWQRHRSRLAYRFTLVWRFKTNASKVHFILTWMSHGNI